MTFQPPAPPPPPGGTPPPPPPPPPGGPTPPPPGQWGVPASGGGFDPKTVNNLDWATMAVGLLVFIFSFVSYYTASVKGFGSAHENGWHGFFGWFAVLCALAGSALVAMSLFSPQVKLPIANRLGALALYAIATLCVLLAWFITPGKASGISGVDYGRGFGFYADLVLIIVGLVLTLMRAQQTNTALPGPLGRMPKIGQ